MTELVRPKYGNTRLSPHFSVREMTKSVTAARLGIDNSLDPLIEGHIPIISNLKHVCWELLEKVREEYGVPFSPSSAYRCLELNNAIGSKPTSQHVTGNAVDFELVGVDNLDLARWCADHLDFDQLILEFWNEDDPRSGWVHASYVSASLNRKEVLTINSNDARLGLPK